MLVMRAGSGKVQTGDPVFGPDGQTLAVPGWEKGVFLWAAPADGAKAEAIPIPGGASLVAFAPDGRTLFAGHEELHAVDTASRKTTLVPAGEAYTLAFAVSPDGTRLVVAAKDIGHTARVSCWAVGSYKKPLWRQDTHLGHGHSLAFPPGSDHFLQIELVWNKAKPGWDSHLFARDLATGAVTNTSAAPVVDHPAHWILSPDGKSLVAFLRDRLHVYPAAGRWSDVPEVRNAGRKQFTGIAFGPSGRYLAAAINDAAVKVYDTTDWSLARTVACDVGKVRGVAFGPDGSLAAGNGAGRVTVVGGVDGRAGGADLNVRSARS